MVTCDKKRVKLTCYLIVGTVPDVLWQERPVHLKDHTDAQRLLPLIDHARLVSDRADHLSEVSVVA